LNKRNWDLNSQEGKTKGCSVCRKAKEKKSITRLVLVVARGSRQGLEKGKKVNQGYKSEPASTQPTEGPGKEKGGRSGAEKGGVKGGPEGSRRAGRRE